MAEVEHAAVQVEVEQLAAVEIPDAVALAAADHEVDAERLQHLHAVRTDVPRREIEDRFCFSSVIGPPFSRAGALPER